MAALLNSLLHRSAQGSERKAPDPRNLKTWRQFVLGVIAQRSTRLMVVAQAVAPWRRVSSVKLAAMALGYFLKEADFPMKPFATRLLESALRRLGSDQLESYRGKVLVVTDPTEYAKRSRGKGKQGRHMEHIGRVRKTRGKARSKGKKARFMVRDFDPLDQLLWIVALAHALVLLALRYGSLAGLRDQAIRLLKLQAVQGRRLTVGKLAEAIGLDFSRHSRARVSAWLL